MKKTLEEDLASLARRIIKMDDKASVSELKEEARKLYEKLTLLEFVNKNIDDSSSGLKEKKSEQSIADQFEVEHDDHHSPDGTEYNPEAISEPNTEKIKDIVSQMPPETQQVDHLVDSSKNEADEQTNKENHTITGVSFDDLPDFEPAHKPLDKKSDDNNDEPNQEEKNKDETSGHDIKENEEVFHETQSKDKESEKETEQEPVNNSETRKKSLNNKLIKDIKLGLNNRLAFTRHLFDGDKQALRDCVKNINKCKNLKEVKLYVEQDIKPQYDYWKGKEKYEERFFDLIETKFPDE